jgi:hypothetical protein
VGVKSRLDLIRDLEKLVDGSVLAYVCGDHPAVQAGIAEDVLKPLYAHLKLASQGQTADQKLRLVLLLVSRGGHLASPWKVVNLIREFTADFRVLIPSDAYSAATMVAMGADKIIMTDMGRLGPIDPSIMLGAPQPGRTWSEIGAEDVAAFVRFVRERVGLVSDSGLTEALAALCKDIDPSMLGQLERLYSHIRVVGQKLLDLHQPPYSKEEMSQIIGLLTEKYLHGHGIARSEALAMGLDVLPASAELSDIAWKLVQEYEAFLETDISRDVYSLLQEDKEEDVRQDFPVAVVESRQLCHVYRGTLLARRVRERPRTPVTLNPVIHLHFDAGPSESFDEEGYPVVFPPAGFEAHQDRILEQVDQEITSIMRREIARLGSETGVSVQLRGARWVDVSAERVEELASLSRNGSESQLAQKES